ncbi:MAG: protoporphyrinogen oxidase [Porphyromonas sp.]|nr:protoporphyrinogen oxidase [Porphyromonas sp.]
MQEDNTGRVPVVIIGGGLTGLSLAAQLDMEGIPFLLLEQKDRLGGQVHTLHEHGYTYEVGPNTGTVSTPEVVEFFDYAAPSAVLEEANEAAANRWIWKGDSFHPLPSGIWSGLRTKLFSWRDKLGIPFEPFKKRGDDPNETVGELAERRLGKSMVEYAVDPFVGGVYAGDPYQLVTRLALPKLYNLEQTYGSFIGGSIKKASEKKSERDKKATKKVFSAEGGLSQLIEAVGQKISQHGEIRLSVREVRISPLGSHEWQVSYTDHEGLARQVTCSHVVSTVRADILPELFPSQWAEELEVIATLPYAPVTEVCVGFDHLPQVPRNSFGGLVPTVEHRKILGILFPSSCFKGRVPYEDGALFTIFMGGLRNPEVVSESPERQIEIALAELYEMIKIPTEIKPDMVHIERYSKAIPQYDLQTEERHKAIEHLETEHPGLHLAGGMKDGIGMAHRITQGMQLGRTISKQLKEVDV